jgi:hypothetical protein
MINEHNDYKDLQRLYQSVLFQVSDATGQKKQDLYSQLRQIGERLAEAEKYIPQTNFKYHKNAR